MFMSQREAKTRLNRFLVRYYINTSMKDVLTLLQYCKSIDRMYICKVTIHIREGVKKQLTLEYMSITFLPPSSPAARRATTGLLRTPTKNQVSFLIIFRYAYQLFQNALKHMILMRKIQNNLKPFQIHIFTFQNILHLFLLIC